MLFFFFCSSPIHSLLLLLLLLSFEMVSTTLHLDMYLDQRVRSTLKHYALIVYKLVYGHWVTIEFMRQAPWLLRSQWTWERCVCPYSQRFTIASMPYLFRTNTLRIENQRHAQVYNIKRCAGDEDLRVQIYFVLWPGDGCLLANICANNAKFCLCTLCYDHFYYYCYYCNYHCYYYYYY